MIRRRSYRRNDMMPRGWGRDVMQAGFGLAMLGMASNFFKK